MNVVPTISERNTLGIIYERGLIGIYHDWWVLKFPCSGIYLQWYVICWNRSWITFTFVLLSGVRPSLRTLGHMTWYMPAASSVCIRTSRWSLLSWWYYNDNPCTLKWICALVRCDLEYYNDNPCTLTWICVSPGIL
jgi:hypothetical protein